jgi:hypothetical protein
MNGFLIFVGVALAVAAAFLLEPGGRECRPTRRRKLARSVATLCLIAAGGILLNFEWGLYRLGQLDSAIGTLRNLANAEATFAEAHAKRGYTCTLPDLAADAWSTSKDMSSLAQTRKRQGYSFDIGGCQISSDGPNFTYRIVARPIRRGGEIVCIDQSGALQYEESACGGSK